MLGITAPRFILIILLISLPVLSAQSSNNSEAIVVAKWDFHEYSIHITVMLFLLVMILLKMAFHRIPYVAEYVPESLLLIIVGVIFGVIIKYAIGVGSFEQTVWKLTPTLFFDYLLPPIILESAYSLYNRTFSEYLGLVLIFAVLGTIFNFLIIGFVMYGLLKAGAFGGQEERFDLKGLLLFSSLIVAVDPVAVLAIFQDIGVELSLYYIVFGESLLNDAITVVLYDIMSAFAGKDVVTGQEIGLGIASFFTVSFGGLLIGVIIGIISCLITRIKSHLNAFTLILLAYFSYIMADTVGWSGIISMIGCGLVQAAYAFHNLDRHSVILVHKLTKLVSEVTESVIFLFLGIEILRENLAWHTGFILWALVCCLFARAVVVLGITAVTNAVNVDGQKTSYAKQLILIYGGLRGAVAFSLAVLVEPHKLGFHGEYSRRVIITATLFIIVFTVGVMGITMKPLVKGLKIRMQGKKKLSLFSVLMNSMIDETLAGIEIITHTRGRNVVRDFFMRLDEKYFRRILQREPQTYDHKIMNVYEKIALQLHLAALQPDKMDTILEDIPETLKQKGLRAIYSNGSLTNLHREASEAEFAQPSTPAGVDQDPAELAYNLRSTRKASIIPHDKRQFGFDDAFRDVMRTRNRAMQLQHRSRQGSADTPGGQFNRGYTKDDEDSDEGNGAQGTGHRAAKPGDRRVSFWMDEIP